MQAVTVGSSLQQTVSLDRPLAVLKFGNIMSSETSSVYIDLTESISQSDSDSLSELSDYGPGMHNNGSESDQHCASDSCIIISDCEGER